MSKSLVEHIINSKVSTILNKDTKQFGKKHLFDGDNETCWNSDQGSPQWIVVTFEQPVQIDEIHCHFQGGFVGKNCHLEGRKDKETEFKPITTFSPQDNSQLQKFQIENSTVTESVKIIFETSTDFFGRITLYGLDFCGTVIG